MRNINELIGIIKGINFDGVINDKEIVRLQSWVDKNRNLAYEPNQIELIKLVDSVLEDRVIDDGERELLLEHSEKLLREMDDDTSKIYELNGIIEGITCDGEVNEAEVYHLKEWMDKYSELIRKHEPSVKLCNAIDDILEDGVVTEEEQQQLLNMLTDRIKGSQFETKLNYLRKLVKAKKNIGIDLIDMLDNQDAMEEIHKRAIMQIRLALSSYSGTLTHDPEVIFISLCLIGMLEYDGSFYDSVRIVYQDVYKCYSQQKIEGLIRTVLDRYRTEEERNKIKGVKNAIISVVLSNAIVPSHYLGAFFEFIYDIYKLNFEYDLPSDLYDEFKFVYDGLRNSMMSDGDNIRDNVTKKTYKLIKTTKQLIAGGKYTDSVIKLSIIIVKLIDKQIWNKDIKIYNPYLKVGFDKWVSTLKDDSERRHRSHSEWYSRWEPRFLLDGTDIYLAPPVHKIKAEYCFWDIYIQVLCDSKIVFEDKSPDIREIIAGYKVCSNRIKIDAPLDRLSYRLMGGAKVIYDSKEKLHRKFVVFDKDGLEIHNNTDYKGTAVFCYIKDQEKFNPYFTSKGYKLAAKNIKYGDSYFIEDVVFNFSALIKPGIFGDDYENVYLVREDSSKRIKVYKKVKFLVFECESRSNHFEIKINDKPYKLSDFACTTTERDGIFKHVINLNINDAGIYDITVYQILDGKKKRLADFDFVLDPAYELSYEKLDDTSFSYNVISDLLGVNFTGLIDLDSFNDESIRINYKGKKCFWILPFDLAAYRLSGSKWRPLSDEIWIGDLNNETILDVYDSEVEEFVVYSAMGQPLETITLSDKGVYRQAAIGFLCSYKEEYDFTFLVFLNQGKVKRAVFCNNKCQMREETEIIYDAVTKMLYINPWFYGRGNVCCEIFNAKDESVFSQENLVNNGTIEIRGLHSFEKYSIVFKEKNKRLGLVLKKNREMKRICRVFYARDDLVGKEFKISEIYCASGSGNTEGYLLSKSYIRILEKRIDESFVAEIYMRESNSSFRSNLVKPVEVEICSDVINGNMEIIVTKKGKSLTLDKQRNHVTDSPMNKGSEVMNYTVIVE